MISDIPSLIAATYINQQLISLAYSIVSVPMLPRVHNKEVSNLPISCIKDDCVKFGSCDIKVLINYCHLYRSQTEAHLRQQGNSHADTTFACDSCEYKKQDRKKLRTLYEPAKKRQEGKTEFVQLLQPYHHMF